MNVKEKTARTFVLISFILLFVLLFRFGLRPFLLTWGADKEEVELLLPGDEYVQNPSYVATRAITIDVRPKEIFPYIVQMGKGKAGMYNFDWFNNGFKRSEEGVMEEWQNIAIGDTVVVSHFLSMKIIDFEKDSFIVWQDIQNPERGTWTWVITSSGNRQSRLISRQRVKYNYASPTIFLNFAVEIGDQAFMRKTLTGIKYRSEATLHGSFSTDIAESLFIFLPFFAMILYLIRYFKKENFWEPLTMVGFMFALFLILLYINLPLWVMVLSGFIVLITLIGTAAESAAIKYNQEATNQTA